ncbi:MAG: ABC transporter substrate-binding protein [Atopobiaceae bacterium]|jgi:iron complex transport system substrate-binding protein|nr:ABC transporter substrate-binding protein [Atopobiaceae bacterium]
MHNGDKDFDSSDEPVLSRRGFLSVSAAASGLAALALSACGSQESSSDNTSNETNTSSDTHTVTDMGATEVELPTEITKYADGWYAHNEVSIMFNQAEGMVATHCDPTSYPWMYKIAPNMNQATTMFGTDFNYEGLVALEPQVVFDSTDNLRDKLASANIPLVNCTFKTFDEMKQSIELTGEVFGGDAPDLATKYNDELDQVLSDVQELTDALTDDERPSVLHGNSFYTLTLDGTGTIIDDWIKVGGGKNANTESTTGNAQATFSLEQVIGWNPDVIITGKPAEVDEILSDSSWADINAVKNKQVYVNPKGVFGWDRYGIEELLQVQWAAATLHPDLFSDLNINEKVHDFYATYLNYDLSDDEIALILAAKNPE